MPLHSHKRRPQGCPKTPEWVSGFNRNGCPETSGIATLPIVEDFDVVEHRVGQVEPRRPSSAIEKFDLNARLGGLHYRVLERIADRTERGDEPGVTEPFGERPRRELTVFSRRNHA